MPGQEETIPENILPLYSDSTTTAFEYNLKILEYSLTHCLTKRAVHDLLKLISDILPQPNIAMRSLYKQDKFLASFLEYPVAEVHKYCCHCHRALEAADACPNGCNGRIERFLICNIEQQIMNLLSGK